MSLGHPVAMVLSLYNTSVALILEAHLHVPVPPYWIVMTVSCDYTPHSHVTVPLLLM